MAMRRLVGRCARVSAAPAAPLAAAAGGVWLPRSEQRRWLKRQDSDGGGDGFQQWNQGKGWGDTGWASAPGALAPDVSRMDERGLADDAEGATAPLLRCIDKEIDDETLRVDKDDPLPATEGWVLAPHEPGSAEWSMERTWRNERHTIRARMTQRDPSLDPECDVRGEHFPFTLTIETPGGAPSLVPGETTAPQVLEFTMDVIEGECVIDSLQARSVRDDAQLPPPGTPAGQLARSLCFAGPDLDEAEEEVLDALQAFLAERAVDDQMAEFIAQQTVHREQLEYERWLKELRRFVAA